MDRLVSISFLMLQLVACAHQTQLERTLRVVDAPADDPVELQARTVERDAGPAEGGPTHERQVRRIELGTDDPLSLGSSESFRCPVDAPDISSPYGMRVDPINRRRHRMHRGVDYRAVSGAPVYAAASGRALMAGWCDSGTGNCVVLQHRHGWRSQYFHMSDVHIRPGQWVRQGDHIGDVGSTGRSTGPHLHFQLSLDAEDIDPEAAVGQPLAGFDQSR